MGHHEASCDVRMYYDYLRMLKALPQGSQNFEPALAAPLYPLGKAGWLCEVAEGRVTSSLSVQTLKKRRGYGRGFAVSAWCVRD